MSNPVDIAVLGVGNMGSQHVRAAIESPHVSSVCGYEPDPVRAAERSRALGIEVTSDLDALLARPNLTGVTIASNNDAHVPLAVAALRAGKRVLCEKPMGENLAEARQVLAVERETGGWLQIGFECRYSMLYTTAKAWIDAGHIGRVLNIHCRYYCSEFHGKGTWRSESPGSLIGEKLSHYLDLQRWFVGRPVTDVFSMAAPNAVAYFNHPDNHQISLRFEGGAIGNLNFVMHLAEHSDGDPLNRPGDLERQAEDGHALQYVIMGEHGAIETDIFRHHVRRWRWTDGPEHLHSRIEETLVFPPEDAKLWFHNVHGQNLRVFELWANGAPPDTPASDAFATMQVCFAAELSERTHGIVHPADLG